MENYLLQGVPVATEQFWERLRQIINEEVNKIYSVRPQEEKLLSPAEVCKLFQPTISKVTLSKWTKEGKLQSHRIGGRVFYKQSEILNSLQKLKKYKPFNDELMQTRG